VREGDERDLPLLAHLLKCSARIHHYRPFELEYLQTLYRELRLNRQVLLLIGQVNGVPRAADLLTVNADVLRGRFIGFDRSGDAPRSAVPAAVTWAGIKWAKAHGLRWYDMGGVPEAVLHDMIDRGLRYSRDWPSATQAKLGWGAVPFRYPAAVEYVRPRVLRGGYELAQNSSAARQVLRNMNVRMRRG
jgi:hypothetical protein